MELNKRDILSPANAISAVGLGLTFLGAANVDSLSGVVMIGAGRTLDLLDGYVARRTHASGLGALVDATFDKVGMAAILIQSYRHEAAPEAVLAVVAAYNVVNAIANVYSDRKGGEAKTSKSGKYGMFGQNVAIGSFALANALGGHTGLEVAGSAAFIGSLPSATKASYGYTKQALKAYRTTTKSHHRHNR